MSLSHTDVIGSAIGLLGLILAIIFYLRAKELALPKYSAVQQVLIGPSQAVLPEKVTILYDGEEVPAISRAVIFFWNHGRRTINRSDIVASDPLKFRFVSSQYPRERVQILEIRSTRSTRGVIGATATTLINPQRGVKIYKAEEVNVSFDFLDYADGFALEILYVGDLTTEIKCIGTIKGVRKGVQKVRAGVEISPQTKLVVPRVIDRMMALVGAAVGLAFMAGGVVSFFVVYNGAASGDSSNNADYALMVLFFLIGLAILGGILFYIRRNIPVVLRREAKYFK